MPQITGESPNTNSSSQWLDFDPSRIKSLLEGNQNLDADEKLFLEEEGTKGTVKRIFDNVLDTVFLSSEEKKAQRLWIAKRAAKKVLEESLSRDNYELNFYGAIRAALALAPVEGGKISDPFFQELEKIDQEFQNKYLIQLETWRDEHALAASPLARSSLQEDRVQAKHAAGHFVSKQAHWFNGLESSHAIAGKNNPVSDLAKLELQASKLLNQQRPGFFKKIIQFFTGVNSQETVTLEAIKQLLGGINSYNAKLEEIKGKDAGVESAGELVHRDLDSSKDLKDILKMQFELLGSLSAVIQSLAPLPKISEQQSFIALQSSYNAIQKQYLKMVAQYHSEKADNYSKVRTYANFERLKTEAKHLKEGIEQFEINKTALLQKKTVLQSETETLTKFLNKTEQERKKLEKASDVLDAKKEKLHAECAVLRENLFSKLGPLSERYQILHQAWEKTHPEKVYRSQIDSEDMASPQPIFSDMQVSVSSDVLKQRIDSIQRDADLDSATKILEEKNQSEQQKKNQLEQEVLKLEEEVGVLESTLRKMKNSGNRSILAMFEKIHAQKDVSAKAIQDLENLVYELKWKLEFCSRFKEESDLKLLDSQEFMTAFKAMEMAKHFSHKDNSTLAAKSRIDEASKLLRAKQEKLALEQNFEAVEQKILEDTKKAEKKFSAGKKKGKKTSENDSDKPAEKKGIGSFLKGLIQK